MIRWLGALALALVIPTVSSGQSPNQSGERAFQRCYSCHSVTKGETGLSGPNLYGLSGRAIAADPGFKYSKAFKNFSSANPRWTPELLDRFLTDPQAVAPGNQMGFFGLTKADERAAIIAYLMASN
ncbi:c-type cytochrome [Blastomonas sp.]|uniref:c-type cytochrome n=1 Tax=Blastomonas sp. TaxID=1909299 RepID=UPI00262AB133|nr:c-type cytochrome [Blastomonas sp.]MDM7955849.1 c-type cytochrome [Blastomonas sp.]